MKVILVALLHGTAALSLPKAAVAFGGLGARASMLHPAGVVAGETVSAEMANTIPVGAGVGGFALDQRRLQTAGSPQCRASPTTCIGMWNPELDDPCTTRGDHCWSGCEPTGYAPASAWLGGACDACGAGGRCCKLGTQSIGNWICDGTMGQSQGDYTCVTPELAPGAECLQACGKFGDCDKCGLGGKCCAARPYQSGDGCEGSTNGSLDWDDHARCVYWSGQDEGLDKAPGFCEDRCEAWCDDPPANHFSWERRCSSDPRNGWPAGTKACSGCNECESLHYNIIKEDAECNSDDVDIGYVTTVRECAQACLQTGGCRYFIYGKKGSQGDKTGRCYYEKTDPVSTNDPPCKNIEPDWACENLNIGCPADQTGCVCSEGWESDSYDFYDTRCAAPNYLLDTYDPIIRSDGGSAVLKCVDCPADLTFDGGHTCDGPRVIGADCLGWCKTHVGNDGNPTSWEERCTWTTRDCSGCDECWSLQGSSSNNNTTTASESLIIAVCVAAAVLLLAVAFVVRKRSTSKHQHRDVSMPSVVEDKAADAQSQDRKDVVR